MIVPGTFESLAYLPGHRFKVSELRARQRTELRARQRTEYTRRSFRLSVQSSSHAVDPPSSLDDFMPTVPTTDDKVPRTSFSWRLVPRLSNTQEVLMSLVRQETKVLPFTRY
ncbi:hypothetical protein ElyMa_002333500 [Elysia marginata]|uniref:Uncharacterized protein n=1 Tax=Elysia marginata TaxID=1093978 RepID=A0AAV4G603_9GAST|nr:hypothetical protein ElyMa_002333500 [Elysia marginata]